MSGRGGTPGPKGPHWPGWAVDMLLQLKREGLNAREIAERIGKAGHRVSRNAVIGKAKRLEETGITPGAWTPSAPPARRPVPVLLPRPGASDAVPGRCPTPGCGLPSVRGYVDEHGRRERRCARCRQDYVRSVTRRTA